MQEQLEAGEEINLELKEVILEEVIEEIETETDVISVDSEIAERQNRTMGLTIIFGLSAVIIVYLIYAMMNRCK